METNNTVKTELEILTKQLRALEPNITREERIEAGLKYLQSERTVYRYLTGEVKKIPLAKKLLSHFKVVISKKDMVAA